MEGNVVTESTRNFKLNYHHMAILATIALFSTSVAALPYISRRNDAGQVSLDIWQTWRNPEDTLTVLLIIGGDIVATALAQLSGPTIVPVAFSFGWVSYSFSVLVKTFGTGRLLPEPDYPVKLFNAQSGIMRENKSWVMGRFMRDGERPLDEATALQIVVYERTSGGRPAEDWCYYSGIIVILIQLGVAAIPCGLYGDWHTLLITGTGTVLALLTGALPQWSQEKFSGRRRTPERAKPKTVVLTKGNGSRNVIVIVDNTKDGGIDLEDLAASQSPLLRVVGSEPMVFGLPRSIRVTQFASVVLAILWTIFLLVTTSPKQHPWYLLLVGGLGMLQNVFVAGAKRTPSAHGIHISDIPIAEFKRKKVMHALMDAEDEYPGVGRVLLSEFFATDTLRDDEKKWWDSSEARDRTPYESRREKQQQKERQRIAQGGQD